MEDAKAEKYAYENLKNVLTTSISKAYLNLKLNEEKIISSLKEIESSKESVGFPDLDMMSEYQL